MEGAFDEFDKKYDDIELAQITTRIIAFFIDVIVFWIIGAILAYLFGKSDGLFFELEGLPALFFIGIGLFLWPISEGLYSQTIGKRVLDIKIATKEEEEFTITRSFLRFFCSFIDVIFCLGIFIATFDSKSRRIGDMVAKTVVIKSKYNG